MKYQKLGQSEQETIALIFDKGDEFIAALTEFARNHKIGGSHFTAIGAFSDVTLGYFDRQRKDYGRIPIEEQVEVLSLVGVIALKDDTPQIHAYVVVGMSDGVARGGHILSAHVWPTRHLCRKTDEETGLALIDLSAV